MTKITTVSMTEEQKAFAEKEGLSVSKLVQEEIEKRRKQTGDRKTQLKVQIEELQNELEDIEDIQAQKQNELARLQEKLEELEENEDDVVSEMIRICEDKITDSNSPTLSKSTIKPAEAETCFNECVDRQITSERYDITSEVVVMLENNGYGEEDLNAANQYKSDSDVDEDSHETATRLVKNNLTKPEKQRVEEWVAENL